MLLVLQFVVNCPVVCFTHELNNFDSLFVFFFNDTATTEIYTRSLVGSVRCV